MDHDLIVVGAGAAGLWAAMHAGWERAARGASALDIVLLDSRRKPGAKILMSGGTRCNLTHRVVEAEDFRGASRNRIAKVLRSHPSEESLRIFTESLGVRVKLEEETGKIFPADDSARTVLAALLQGVERTQVPLLAGERCVRLEAREGAWHLELESPEGAPLPTRRTRRVLLATGGCSFPKSGSDGRGYEMLRELGHAVVSPVPALTPVTLDGDLHTRLSGISLPVTLTLYESERAVSTARGPMLWTHAGVSGPAALDISGPLARARADRPQAPLRIAANFLADESTEELERRWLELARLRPSSTLRGLLDSLPRRQLDEVAFDAGADPARPLAQTPREARTNLCRLFTNYQLPVTGVLGFNKAEVTSGGVPLEEVDGGFESKLLPGLHLAGEVLHVDGRLGGFNFQWAWSSGALAGRAAVARLLQPE